MVSSPDHDGAVSRSDLREWAAEFDALTNLMSSLFADPRSQKHARQYVEGLLAPLERKNGWTIAEFVGEKEPKGMQRFLNLAKWDAGAMRDLVRDYAMLHFADPQGVLVADPTGFAKKGRKSAGVQRQYSGTLGRVDNCQIGTFLAYVDSRGNRTPIDCELYVPESWFADRDRCTEAGIPPSTEFATRPVQVAAMIDRAVAADVPFSWFTADEEFGQNPGLRAHLEDAGIAYVMAVPKNTEVGTPDGLVKKIEDVAAAVRPADWTRRACGLGAKGFRTYDWAVIASGQPTHLYMIRRSIDDGELAYYHCHNPRHAPVTELVRVAGSRWPIEECFQTGKGQVGLDNYQVRLYHAWYRHMSLAMLAQTFLAVTAHQHHNKKGALQPARPARTRPPSPATSTPISPGRD